MAILPLSAKSPDALRALAARFAELLESDPVQPSTTSAGTPPRDGRPWNIARSSSRRIAPQWRTVCGAMPTVRAAAAQGVVHGDVKPKIAFVCPGQGAQWVGMARQLT